MQNKSSNFFCMCQIHHIRLSLSGYCIKVQVPITQGFPGKKKHKNIATFVLAWRQFLRPADVKDIFDHARKPNHIKASV